MHAKLVTLDALLPKLAEYRTRLQRIVATNGCFDLLHAGHVATLEAARRLGDLLIVAVNSDASVTRLKGPTRPIVPEDERAYMLASLVCVDYVVLFDEDTPHRVLEAIRPHVLVKGGSTPEVVGRELVEAWGGHCVTTGLVEGVSTTQRIRRIEGVARG